MQAPTPARRNRLKRRVGGGTAVLESQPFTLEIDDTNADAEPPLKKFKALFDSSHQENFDETAFEDLQSGTYTQTQSQAESGSRQPTARSGTIGTNLTTLQEEEEETQSSPVQPRGTKRPIANVEDVEMDVDESGPSVLKKRAVENVNAIEKTRGTSSKPPSSATVKPTSGRAGSKPPSTATATSKPPKGGAQPGKPDQDQTFLKAIASTKKGKKTEDDFDREFNKLKISKPVLGREEPEEEWAVMAEFGDETNIRGNFMMIVEMPAYNRGARERHGELPPEWDGKPNFKKFKKVRKFTYLV